MLFGIAKMNITILSESFSTNFSEHLIKLMKKGMAIYLGVPSL